MKLIPSTINDGFFRLLIITSLVCGLEFCTASAFTYIPPILLKAGISESSMTWLMGCGPLLGFLLCPVVGHASDRCRSRYGKRRPFIMGFCLTIILCLILIPQSEAIGEILQAPTIGLYLLVITCILFDFAAQACFNPCESLIYDICKGTPQESSCFYVYSFMTSFGN
jgi:Na+/melibiose symporter-like transporter